MSPNPEVAARLCEAIEDTRAYYALAGQHRPDVEVVREGVRTLGDVDAIVLLVSLMAQDWPVVRALQAAWNLAGVDRAALVAHLQCELLLTWNEVLSVVGRAGAGPSQGLSLMAYLEH